jgi:hypothetical protein
MKPLALLRVSSNGLHSRSHPTLTVFFPPNSSKLLNELYCELFLSEIATRFDNDRDTVPICWRQDKRKLTALREKKI